MKSTTVMKWVIAVLFLLLMWQSNRYGDAVELAELYQEDSMKYTLLSHGLIAPERPWMRFKNESDEEFDAKVRRWDRRYSHDERWADFKGSGL